MPHSYTDFPGKLNTRYSELSQCTPYGVHKVIEYRQGLRGEFTNPSMELGAIRHEQFAEESRKTGQLPNVFKQFLPVFPEYFTEVCIEEEIAAEIFPGVVLHSTPDLVSIHENTAIIVDYKCSSQNPRVFEKSKQHLVYAFQLLVRGILCTEFYYLIECWDKEKTQIIGYKMVKITMDRASIMSIRDWLWERVSILQTAIDIL